MHNQFLLSALEQAWLGRGFCAPNPAVGAVAIQNGNIIAQAFHCGSGTPHAEQLLLAQFPPHTKAVTLYVTLEPCNHWGKTPPCVDAIIAHGVERVVYAYRDPNPIVLANDTTLRLSKQGIDVIHYPMPEIDRFYQSYHHWTVTKKPWVTVKIAQTFDGKIAGPNGARTYLSNALCNEFTQLERYKTDVILTTARTVIADNPQLNVRLKDATYAKPLAILDQRLEVHALANLFKTVKHCHIYHDAAYPVLNPIPHCTYHAIPLKQGKLDLSFVLTHLGEYGYQDVWVEAGGRLFCALHQSKLVNRTHLYLVPKILGANATSLCQDSNIFNQAKAISWLEKGDNMIASLDWLEDTCLPG